MSDAPYTGGASVSICGASPSEITRVTVNKQASASQRQRVSVAHLGSTMNDLTEEPYVEIWQPDGGSGSTVEVEYIGSPIHIAGGTTGAISVSGPFSISATAATVTNCVITGSVGDLVRGTISARF